MHIFPAINTPNYRNQTSFGMAFKKPSPEVNKIFNDTLRAMNQKEREVFVASVGQLVERAKSCPVDIEHTIVTSYTPHYGAKVRGNIYSYDTKSSTNRANSIIDSMSRAVQAAENEHNIDINQERLNKIFNA